AAADRYADLDALRADLVDSRRQGHAQVGAHLVVDPLRRDRSLPYRSRRGVEARGDGDLSRAGVGRAHRAEPRQERQWGAARVGAMRTAGVPGDSRRSGAARGGGLAGEGYGTVRGARGLDRLQELAAEVGGEAIALDVTDPASVTDFAAAVGECDVLVNNAGGALGLDPVAEADDGKWLRMYESNVIGTMRMTRALLPRLVASGDGHVVGV